MKLRLYQYDLPLKHVFRISRGALEVQTTVIVELEQAGCRGYGEATTNPYYGFTVENIAGALSSARSVFEATELDDPAEFWNVAHQHMADNPFALCALDQAAHDLWGKLQGKPVYELWGLNLEQIPASNYTIGIDEIETMVAKMQEFADWPIYKIKLGTDQDLEIVRRLREQTDATFRVDANCGWTAAQTIGQSPALKDLGVEFIEQPLPADQWDPMRDVRQQSALPVIADESCIVEADVAKCDGAFHGINIKLVKCGGLTPARRMIQEARQLGLQVMVGCMTESSVGISAIAHLLPLLDYVDMDGAVLLAEDIAEGVQLRQGQAVFPERPGLGVELTKAGQEL